MKKLFALCFATIVACSGNRTRAQYPSQTPSAETVRTLLARAGRQFQREAFSQEGLATARDAIVMSVHLPEHPHACDALSMLQNALCQRIEPFMPSIPIPENILEDLLIAEPTLLQACPSLAQRAEEEAREALMRHTMTRDVNDLLRANDLLRVRNVRTQTTCQAATDTFAAMTSAAQNGSRHLTRTLAFQYGELLFLCQSITAHPRRSL